MRCAYRGAEQNSLGAVLADAAVPLGEDAIDAASSNAGYQAEGIMLRVDPGVAPTMFRGAVVSESELALLRQRIQSSAAAMNLQRLAGAPGE